MARGKSVIQVQITGEASGLQKATGLAVSALGGFVSVAATVVSAAGSIASAIGVASVKAFADFDSALNQSLAIMGDVSASMEKEMSDAAREVAKTTTFSAEQAAEAFYFLASAGLDAEASIEALPLVAQFAQAGMFDLSTATDLLTDAQSALGLAIRDDAVANMENMTRVADVLVDAANLSNASVEQFSESLTNKAGAALSVANKSIEEGVAVLAVFADQGVKGAEAGESLSIMLRDISRAAATNTDEFKKFGINVFDAEGNLRNMADVTAEFERVLLPMSDAQKAVALDTLGLTRSVADNIKLVLGASDEIRNYESALLDAGGTTEDVAGKQLETFSAQMQLLRSNVFDVFIEIGSFLVPKLLELFEAFGGMDRVKEILTGVSDTFKEFWTNSVEPLITSFVTNLPGAIDGLRAGFDENLRPVIETLSDIFVNHLVPAVMDAAGFFRDEILPVLGTFWAFIRDNVLPIVDRLVRMFIDNLVPTIKNFLTPVLDGIRSVIEKVTEKFEENRDNIKTWMDRLEPVITFIRDTAAPIIGAVFGGAFEILAAIIGPIIDLFFNLLDIITKVIEKVVDFGRKIADSRVGQAIGGIIDSISGRREFGGPVYQGQAYIVGEAGPELFVPTISGSIVPNNEMSMGGGGGTVINITVTSADPNAVVDAIRKYTRSNGPLGQVVAL